ncbi:MAG TPA: DUF4384 domain-containing protein [Pyrinomonadaceae bacterium]
MTRISLLILAFLLSLTVHAQPQKNRSIRSEDFTNTRPISSKRIDRSRIPSRIYRQASKPLKKPLDKFSPSTLKIGVTLWKIQPGPNGIAKRVETDTPFREDELLRLTIESPRSGYLYVIDRDWFNDGAAGDTNLIFPLRGDDNRLQAGKLIEIPAEDKAPFKTKPKPNQVGEMLTIIVTESRLSLPLSNSVLPISNNQLAKWEETWSGSTERFEMNGGTGQARTIEEQEAASRTRARQLTRDDPSPQTIYFLTPKNREGLLFNLTLSYIR